MGRRHGLYGPPSDYIKFERALLRGGELDGTRILRSSTVDEAFRNQIGDLDFPAELSTVDPASTCIHTRAPASSGATGCCSTPRTSRACEGPGPEPGPGCATPSSGWTARTGICGTIYSNFLPFVTPEAVELYNDFERHALPEGVTVPVDSRGVACSADPDDPGD